MIYLDTSALVKLVFDEPESDALSSWLAQRQDVAKISSQIATIELLRTCRRRDEGATGAARQVLEGLDLIPLSVGLVEQAGLVGPPGLRTLDAIHLASALTVSEHLSAFVVYDARLGTAAADAGLEVAVPA
ncbi:MAG: type II toxin-antitoxin system VapC family toxin [Acidimicrobiales bacterium]